MVRRNSIVLFVATALVLQVSAHTVVEILYETHCPDSQFIMRDGVNKSLALLPDVKFVLVPYGKAITRGEGKSLSFSCQHGIKECEGNTFHACAIELHKNELEVLKFAICTMSYRQSVLDHVGGCAKDNGIDSDALHICATGQQGKELLAKMGRLTQEAAKKINNRTRLDFVPSTLIDGVPHVIDAYNDLYKTICKFAKEKPSKCL